MNFTKSELNIIYSTIRQFLYFIATFAFVLLINVIAKHYKSATFEEHGIIENMQLSFLLSAGIVFFINTLHNKTMRSISFILASFCFFATCRELDSFFDKLIPVISWKFGYFFPLLAGIYAFLTFNSTIKSSLQFLASQSFFMMCCAIIIILPIAQCIGHRPLIVAVLGQHNVADIKQLFEECCELIGYFIILLSSIEYNINFHKK
mgnify:CR=1 FL=1